jgi:hypothetical protein
MCEIVMLIIDTLNEEQSFFVWKREKRLLSQIKPSAYDEKCLFSEGIFFMISNKNTLIRELKGLFRKVKSNSSGQGCSLSDESLNDQITKSKNDLNLDQAEIVPRLALDLLKELIDKITKLSFQRKIGFRSASVFGHNKYLDCLFDDTINTICFTFLNLKIYSCKIKSNFLFVLGKSNSFICIIMSIIITFGLF